LKDKSIGLGDGKPDNQDILDMKKKLGDDLAALIKKLAIKYNVMESIIRQKLDDNDK